MEQINRLRILVSGEITPVVIELKSPKKEALEVLANVARENNCFSLIDSVPGDDARNLQLTIRVVCSLLDLSGDFPASILERVDNGKLPTVDVTGPIGSEVDEENFAKELGSFVNLAAIQ